MSTPLLTKDDICNVVRRSSNVDSLDEKPSRGEFGNQRKANSSEGELVTDLPGKKQPSNGPERRSRVEEADSSDNPKDDIHKQTSVEVE